MSDSSPFHLETFERPVSGRNRSNESLSDAVSVKLELFDRVEFGRSIRFLENFVDIRFEIVVELLEQIFKE